MELLKRRPGSRIVILEKEGRVAQHQTGHNSGVIHSGIYYPPGSLKAELCRRGALATKSFCEEHGIPYEVCGKMLVATNTLEAERMKALFERAKKNNIDVEQLDAEELRRREPKIAGVGALFVRSTGIVDYGQVAETMGQVIRSLGGEIEFDINVDSIQESSAEVLVAAGERRWTAKRLVVCAGLQSDRLV
jgi:(S)-2-hydroxyglutarate dehydrogenase